ncbi:MAG: sigma-70 family RNA polymerase sigma factor [Verrucomicrobiales bacterium]|nr:sigma-70 family RNA polymerase sigma factor [Verrucomicrobiales bacterium]
MNVPPKILTIVEPAPDELLLVARAQRGDTEAFDRLCRLYGDRLLRQAQALCGGRGSPEDLVQETLVQSWKSLRRYNGQCQLFTWFCSILIHRHRDSLRKRLPTPFSWLFGGSEKQVQSHLLQLSDPEPGPSLQAELGEQAGQLLRSLNQLPEKQRLVLYLRFYADESLEGIAGAIGCSVGTVKSRLFHGLERLRKLQSRSNDTPTL